MWGVECFFCRIEVCCTFCIRISAIRRHSSKQIISILIDSILPSIQSFLMKKKIGDQAKLKQFQLETEALAKKRFVWHVTQRLNARVTHGTNQG